MEVQRFVHLSDIHIGQERGGTLPLHETIRTDLLKDCEKLRERLGPASGIVVCGDTAYSGKRAEYVLAGTWLDRLARAVGSDRERGVFVIPGNHDVDRAFHSLPTKHFHAALRSGTINQAYAEIEEVAEKTPEDQNPLLTPLGSYREFASQYDCDFESPKRPMWTKSLPVGARQLRLLGLNSVVVSNSLDAKESMILGNSQFIFESLPGHANVVLLHHPLEWFKDREMAQHFINSRASVLIVGHEHKARIQKITDENDNELLIIESGATNPPDEGGEYKFAYNWLEIRTDISSENCRLGVKVFPRLWVSGRTEFSPDASRLSLDKSEGKEFFIKCPKLKEDSQRSQDASTVDATEEVTGESSSGAVSVMPPSDEVNFARLQFYFWRFLDWRQRLTVLAENKLLPGSLERPIPQTMERLALESARSSRTWGTLGSDYEICTYRGPRSQSIFRQNIMGNICSVSYLNGTALPTLHQRMT